MSHLIIHIVEITLGSIVMFLFLFIFILYRLRLV